MQKMNLGLMMHMALAGVGNTFAKNNMLGKGIKRIMSNSKAGRQMMTGYRSKTAYGGKHTGQAKSRRAAVKRNNIRKHN